MVYILCFMYDSGSLLADAGGRAVYGVDLGRLVTGIGSKLARGVDVCLCVSVVLSCVGRGLCDGLIARPKES
jgi:hypothetical protein